MGDDCAEPIECAAKPRFEDCGCTSAPRDRAAEILTDFSAASQTHALWGSQLELRAANSTGLNVPSTIGCLCESRRGAPSAYPPWRRPFRGDDFQVAEGCFRFARAAQTARLI